MKTWSLPILCQVFGLALKALYWSIVAIVTTFKSRTALQVENLAANINSPPVLANLYQHYRPRPLGEPVAAEESSCDVIIVRYADDAVRGLQYRDEAERFLKELGERLGKFGLELHPEKMRPIEFGRYAAKHRKERGESLSTTSPVARNPSHAVMVGARKVSRCPRSQFRYLWLRLMRGPSGSLILPIGL
jgi:hypothetical protein